MVYWKRFLPLTVAALEKQGPDALETAVRAAGWRMEYNTLLLQLRSPTLRIRIDLNIPLGETRRAQVATLASVSLLPRCYPEANNGSVGSIRCRFC